MAWHFADVLVNGKDVTVYIRGPRLPSSIDWLTYTDPTSGKPVTFKPEDADWMDSPEGLPEGGIVVKRGRGCARCGITMLEESLVTPPPQPHLSWAHVGNVWYCAECIPFAGARG